MPKEYWRNDCNLCIEQRDKADILSDFSDGEIC